MCSTEEEFNYPRNTNLINVSYGNQDVALYVGTSNKTLPSNSYMLKVIGVSLTAEERAACTHLLQRPQSWISREGRLDHIQCLWLRCARFVEQE